MKEYAFLCSKSWSTPGMKAKNLKDAWRLARAWYLTLEKDRKELIGELTSTYAIEQNDWGIMSEWKTSKTLGYKHFNKNYGYVVNV